MDTTESRPRSRCQSLPKGISTEQKSYFKSMISSGFRKGNTNNEFTKQGGRVIQKNQSRKDLHFTFQSHRCLKKRL